MANRLESDSDVQHAPDRASSTHENAGTARTAETPRFEMDQDGPIEWAADVSIPYRLSHEAGRALDEIDSRGMVP
jgi:hypothetical protein